MSRKFERGRFLVIGGNPRELQSQFAQAKREVEVWSHDNLTSKLSPDLGAARFETAAWFYPSGANEDEQVAEALTRCADGIILLPGPGADAARRRPELVQCFCRLGFVPDYECGVTDLNPAAVCLRQLPSKPTGEFVSAVETAFARLNRHLAALRRTLEIRGSELEAAHRHIAARDTPPNQAKPSSRLKVVRDSPQYSIGGGLPARCRFQAVRFRTIRAPAHTGVPAQSPAAAPRSQ